MNLGLSFIIKSILKNRDLVSKDRNNIESDGSIFRIPESVHVEQSASADPFYLCMIDGFQGIAVRSVSPVLDLNKTKIFAVLPAAAST